MAETEVNTGLEASKPPPQQNTDFKLTKCVTIRTQARAQDRYPGLQYLHVLSGEAQCLGKCDKSNWKLPNDGHVFLHIDIPNHQVYPLPLLITPFPCIYLISFNLDEGEKALKSIHDILKDVYSYSERLDTNVKPAVFLVGLQREEKDRSTFTEQLEKMLETRSYNTLVVRTKRGKPYWTSCGAELNILDDDNFALLCGIQGNCRHPPTQLTYQSLARHCELHHQFNDGEPFVLYKDVEARMASAVQDTIENHNFEDYIKMLHSVGLIVYDTFKELKQSETVVVRQPQSLCQLLAEVQQLSKTRESVTIADLLRTTMIKIHGREKEEWFQKFCSRVGLVIERETAADCRTNYVFVMGLDPKFKVPERAHYSVDPLLVMYRPPGVVQKTGDCLLPSPLFPAFVTAFLKKLKETSPNQTNLYVMKRHYLRVSARGALNIQVVEREQFIEIGLQQFHVLPGGKWLNKLQRACQDIRSIVSESAICAAANPSLGSSSPSLGSSNIHLGFLCSCGTSEPVECFGEFNQEDSIVTCSNHTIPKCPTPQQQIWFSNIDKIDEEVRVRPVCVTVAGCNTAIRKLETASVHHASDQESPPNSPNPPRSHERPSAPPKSIDTSCTVPVPGATMSPLLTPSPPDTADIVEALSPKLDAKWKRFGTFLHVDYQTMEAIRLDNGGRPDDCMLDLLSKWTSNLAGTGTLPRTWQTILEAVRKTGFPVIAENLAHEHGVIL